MAAIWHLSDPDVVAEIETVKAALARYRGALKHPWNPAQADKLRQQIEACELHLERLRGLL